MLKKIDRGALFLEKNYAMFRCPKCHENFSHDRHYLICKNNHQYDLSKKGTVYFLDHQVKTEYDKEMFLPRGRMIRSGMYQPVIKQLAEWVTPGKLLDVGCGEGSFLAELNRLKSSDVSIGFDLAKEGVYLATDQKLDAFWCVADLTNLPFSDQSFDTILNIFSPSHYKEFHRVLRENGSVLKVIPQENYLRELREAFYPDGKPYTNEAVIDRFNMEMSVEKRTRLTYEFAIPIENQLDLLEMSPLEWQAEPSIKQGLMDEPLEKITIDVEILKGH
ncbi:methyltransferase domain-containing protein [Enterococcus pallens]|uniref:Methyltransferase n=1 Tax=Enterococcus pallens ATCC BAA-351 TaxID=1158607 RepID=R2S4P1_9ENTE|nr:methyltransferase domain-containing protein [Enterococcus pallens]EOH87871.1 methyltransferase [Enterococcus pallens ATCC BAA-351]EOU18085.1 methyltransferase [Enterococcus pallens ATCC BAA-351]OJG82292.1 methyltransferase [Enterococcus pallens]